MSYQGIGELGKDDRNLGHLPFTFSHVVEIVQTDGNDFRRTRDRGSESNLMDRD